MRANEEDGRGGTKEVKGGKIEEGCWSRREEGGGGKRRAGGGRVEVSVGMG